MNTMEYAFLGAGRMATALAKGFIQAGVAPEKIRAYDSNPEAADIFAENVGARAVAIEQLKASVLVLAVKPQYLAEALSPVAAKDMLVISVVAGVPLARLQALTGAERIIRVMPNTPALIGAGAGAYAATAGVTEQELGMVRGLLAGCGEFFQVKESLMDAVTGLSGSGPAYVYWFIQALADGGVAAGLPRDVALRLAAQTVAGAAQMVIETGEHPIALCDAVMSPGGTTACGVLELAKGAFQSVTAQAVLASAAKAAELGRK